MTEKIPVFSQRGEIPYRPIDLPSPAPHPVRVGVEACACEDPIRCRIFGCMRRVARAEAVQAQALLQTLRSAS